MLYDFEAAFRSLWEQVPPSIKELVKDVGDSVFNGGYISYVAKRRIIEWLDDHRYSINPFSEAWIAIWWLRDKS